MRATWPCGCRECTHDSKKSTFSWFAEVFAIVENIAGRTIWVGQVSSGSRIDGRGCVCHRFQIYVRIGVCILERVWRRYFGTLAIEYDWTLDEGQPIAHVHINCATTSTVTVWDTQGVCSAVTHDAIARDAGIEDWRKDELDRVSMW